MRRRTRDRSHRIDDEWNYPDIGIGNWRQPAIKVRNGYTGVVYLQLGPTK